MAQYNSSVNRSQLKKLYLLDKNWWLDWTKYTEMESTNELRIDGQKYSTDDKKAQEQTNFDESRLNCLPSIEFTEESNKTSKVIHQRATEEESNFQLGNLMTTMPATTVNARKLPINFFQTFDDNHNRGDSEPLLSDGQHSSLNPKISGTPS